jgi:single-strand DNA-binding protein
MAMADLNKVFLMGSLALDPELRYTPSGTAVTDLRLVTSRTWTGKDGEKKEDKLYIDVTVWDRQAENCCQYLKKGRPIHVEGSLKAESWDDKTTGEKKTKIKVIADRVQFLGGPRDDSGGSSVSHDEESSAPPSRRSAPPAANGATGASRGGYNSGPNPSVRKPAAEPDPEADDDIPF